MTSSAEGGSSDERAAGTAAARAVEAYERAWRDASYDDYLALATEDLRSELGISTRADFAAAAADFAESSHGLSAQVTGIHVDADAVTVVTTETSLDGGDHELDKVAHRLVRRDGAWRIDAIEAFEG